MTAFEVTYKISARKSLTAIRFYNSLEEAEENCAKVFEIEQGYKVVSIIETKDPREE